MRSYLKKPPPTKRETNWNPPPRRRNTLARAIALALLAGSVVPTTSWAEKNVDFDVDVKLSWNEYSPSNRSVSARATGSTGGKCGHDADQYGTVNIPFQQAVTLVHSVSGSCRSNYSRYIPEGGSWTTFVGVRTLNNYQGSLSFHAHARNDRDGGLFDLKCRSCTVTTSVSFSGGTPAPKENSNTESFSILSSQKTPQKIKDITVPTSGNVSVQDAKCEANTKHKHVKVLCQSIGNGFALYANINNKPPIVNNPSPEHDSGTELELEDVTLNWTGSDPDADPITYDVFFGSEKICADISSSTCLISKDKLDYGTRYLWRVEANDGYETTKGEVWEFTIRQNLPPTAPTYIPPSLTNGIENVDQTQALTFSWNPSTDPDNDEITYQLCRQKAGEDIVCNPKQSETSKTWPADTLEYETAYEWFVVAQDTAGNKTLGDKRTFTTQPAPVKLLLEAKSGYTNTLLEWDITNAAEVASYRILRVEGDAELTPEAEIDGVNAPNTSFLDEDTLTSGNQYCYRIDALDVEGKALHQSNPSCVTAAVTTLEMPNSGALKGEKVNVPIQIPNAGGLRIGASDIWLRYDGAVIEFNNGLNNTPLSTEYVPRANVQDDTGTMKIVKISLEYMGSEIDPPPITGEGPLVELDFKAIGDHGSSSPLELVPFVKGQGGSSIQDHEGNDIPLNLNSNSFNVRKVTRDGKQETSPRFFVGEAYVRGDLNGNGTIQTIDARMARLIGIGRTVPTSEQRTAGDINGDGWIDSADANMIIHHVLNDEWPSVPSENTRRAKRDGKNTPIIISLDDVEGISGSEVTTTLSLNNLVDLASLNLAIVYDPNVVEKVVKVERTGLAANSSMMFYDAGEGMVRINMDTQTPIHGSGAFATLTLQLKEDGDIRSMPLSVAHANLYDMAGRDFVISALQRKLEARHAKATVTDVEEVPVLKDDAVVTAIEDLLSNNEPISEAIYSASGTVLDQNGQPVDGVTVQVGDKTVITDETGQWKISELSKGQHEVTAFKAGYTFDSQLFTVEEADVVIAFSDNGTPPVKRYLGSGQILDDFGKPIEGVTVQIGEQTTLTDETGYWEIGDIDKGTYTLKVYNDAHQFASKKITFIDADRVIEVDTQGPHTASGTIRDKFGKPITGVTVQVGDKETVTDGEGYWEVNALFEGNYNVIPSKSGYIFTPNECGVSPGQPCETNFEPESVLNMKVIPEPRVAQQGENVTYTINVTNSGEVTATGITLTNVMLEGTSFVSIKTLDGGSCDGNTMTCSLPNLKPSETATAQVVMSSTNTSRMVNKVVVTANEYPADVKMTWTQVKPYLSVSISDKPDPVIMEKEVHYVFKVELNQYAPSAATDVKLRTTLPSGVELKSVNSDYGTCDLSQSPTVTCSLTDLSIGSAENISQATVDMDVVLKDAGLLLLTPEAKVSANEYPAHTDRERTTISIPEDIEVDITFVVDVTGSMQEEINGVVKALKQFIAEIDPNNAPLIALVVFADDVKIKAFTRDLKVLLKEVEKLKASGGGTCPEASVEALLIAVPHTKAGGDVLFATDASPYDDADVEKVIELLRSKGIRFNAMITGDCSMPESWNNLQ
jgi:uncharacterized repeat protein (TIGR01451 family)